jgi:hypothetical protein
MAVHHQDFARRQHARRVENMSEEGAARERMQDLGQVGAHPLAQTGSENNDFEGHRAGF